jgi:hypothetical protein
MRILVLWVLSCALSCAYAEDLMNSQLADQARQWQEKGRDDLAADLWRKILRADPKHAEARAKLLQIEAPKTTEVPKPTAPQLPLVPVPVVAPGNAKSADIAPKTKPPTPSPVAADTKANPTSKAASEQKPELTRPLGLKAEPKPAVTKEAPADSVSVKSKKPEVVKGRTVSDKRYETLAPSRNIGEPQLPLISRSGALSPLSPAPSSALPVVIPPASNSAAPPNTSAKP